MLWLGLYFPDLPLEIFAAQPPAKQSLAVIGHGREGAQVVRCNAPARARGVRPGQRLQTALSLDGTLQARTRDRRREQDALQGLALWALQFSSHISFEPSLLLLEIGASLRLFGGLDPLLARVRQELPGLEYRACHGVAPVPMAAALLARERPARQVLAMVDLREALADIPVARLTRNERVRGLVRDIGLHTVGECLALPRAELARRAGPGLLQLLDRLQGKVPDPRTPWQPPARFGQTIELQAEIRHHTALVFPARRLLLAACGFLRGRGVATQRLLWSLQHREDLPDTPFQQGLLAPSRDPEHLLALFRERIERVTLAAPVTGMGLEIPDCQPFAEATQALFAAGPRQDSGLLERLGSRLGDCQVRGLGMCADHRPEYSVDLTPPGQGRATHIPPGQLPAWLLPEPSPLDAASGVPHHGGPLELQEGPRRIESGWWDGDDVARDYYRAVSRAGERLWVFRDRRSGEWFLHGLFD